MDCCLYFTMICTSWMCPSGCSTSWLWFSPDPGIRGHCVPVSDVAGRRHLRSSAIRRLIVPLVSRSTFGSLCLCWSNSLRTQLLVTTSSFDGVVTRGWPDGTHHWGSLLLYVPEATTTRVDMMERPWRLLPLSLNWTCGCDERPSD